jgi:HTH-type transcriptional regulator/antitoxin HigA
MKPRVVRSEADYAEALRSIEAPSPFDAIRFRMEQLGLRQTDLAPLLGGRSRVSEVLGGKRALTINMIRALHTHIGIPLRSLVGVTGLEQASVATIDAVMGR